MKDLKEDDYKKIIARRDRRFDGRFYFGVKTTHIYCRPVCPAKPKPENILLFKSASEAERSGYRPCMRCRPDLTPGNKLLDGTLSTVSRALRIMSDSTGDEPDVKNLADSLGISDRHLRRLFEEHLGASPIEVLITQRLHFSKQLVQNTTLSITEIAFASGFQSVRRFNEAFQQRFHKSPSELRKREACSDGGGLILKIPVRIPYDWNTVLSYLARHECYGLECIDHGKYRRFIPYKGEFGVVTVSEDISKGFLSVEFVDVPLVHLRSILHRMKNLFDTEHNPIDLPISDKLVPKGIRVPGSFDPFEAGICIILSQFVSTKHAKAKLKDLVQRFGTYKGISEWGEVYEFPSSVVLSEASIEEIGIAKSKAQAIREFSAAVRKGMIDFRSHAEFPEMYGRFLKIKGIGPWTASMLSMRCLGNPDAFPKADLIIQRAINQGLVNEAGWSSSRAYLTHCLWRDYGDALSNRNRNRKKI